VVHRFGIEENEVMTIFKTWDDILCEHWIDLLAVGGVSKAATHHK
jgi:hypothetical protein